MIAEVHWGTEGMLYPDQSQRHLAEQIAQAGADVIIGGHPHRLQGVAFVGDVPIAYSLGNFWFSTGTLYTTLSKVTITEDGTVKTFFCPLYTAESYKQGFLQNRKNDQIFMNIWLLFLQISELMWTGWFIIKMRMTIRQERFYMTLIQAGQILSGWLIMRGTRLTLSVT